MSVQPADDGPPADEASLRAILIDNCRISTESVDRISEFMLSSGRTFGDSALQLGLITPAEMEDAKAWARRASGRGDAGLVETAIRRASGGGRRMLSRIGHQVRPGRDLLIIHEPYSSRSEKLRALRTELLLLANASARAVTVAVLSPLPGEGRTQLAAERSDLAAAHAGALAVRRSRATLRTALARLRTQLASARQALVATSAQAAPLSGDLARLTNELHALTSYVTSTPSSQLDAGYLQAQVAYVSKTAAGLSSALEALAAPKN